MEDGIFPTDGWIMVLAKKHFTVFKAARSSLSLLPLNRKPLLLRIVHRYLLFSWPSCVSREVLRN